MVERAPTYPNTAQFIDAALCGTGAVSIWAGWIVVTRLGVTSNLTAMDIAALRFGVAGLILLPVVLRRGLAIDRLGPVGFVALAAGGGAPFVLVVGVGLLFAPAAHAGALFPGVMPLFVALLATFFLKERLFPSQKIGLGLILFGMLAIGGFALPTPNGMQYVGHSLFVCAAFLWACYTVSMRRGRLDGLHAAAIASVMSMVIYLPIYAIFFADGLLDVPVVDLAFQAFYQGLLTMVVSLFLYGRAVALLGASNGAAFGALSPAIAALLAIPVLGEVPTVPVWTGIGLITGGVYLASGAPLLARTPRSTNK